MSIMKENVIFVFPGQGSQYVGMAQDMFKDFATMRYTFQQVSDLAHKDIAKICFHGTKEELNSPENTSLATLAHSVAAARVIQGEYGVPMHAIAYAMAGHSMGQYSALHCAGSLAMDDTVRLLSARSSYMDISGKNGGGMIGIVGLGENQIQEILMLAQEYGYAAISNHNAHDQFIISGENDALNVVLENARARGARIAKRLNIAIPAHCVLMRGAEELLRTKLQHININAPKTNWFSNHTANFMHNPTDVKNALANQMTHGVRWMEIMEKFPAYNITRAYELGPGHTLTRLINRAQVGCVALPTDNGRELRIVLKDLERLMVYSR